MRFWFFLSTGILSEVFGTTSLKLADGFSRPWYVLLTILLYGLSFYFFTCSLKGVSMVLVYALWSGLGTALIAVVGILLFKETLDWLKLLSLFLIVAGIIGLQLAGIGEPKS
jgi:small multidrug resistance pump